MQSDSDIQRVWGSAYIMRFIVHTMLLDAGMLNAFTVFKMFSATQHNVSRET